MAVKYFYREDCPHCKNVSIPSEWNVKHYNTDTLPYAPQQVPMLDLNGVQIQGDQAINAIIKSINEI